MYNPKEENNFSSIENEIQKIMQPAETSEHIYIMADVLTAVSQEWGSQAFNSLIMELYIRALTADVNFMERIKLQNDKEQMTAHEKHLAARFLALADLVGLIYGNKIKVRHLYMPTFLLSVIVLCLR